MNFIKTIKIVAVFFVFIIFLSGCALQDKLGWLDQKAGEMFFTAEKEVPPAVTQNISNPPSSEELTKEMMSQIDAWLEENGYNRYGDPIGAMYAGGTPLFDEATGERIDRYDYILKKIPDILNKINN